MIRQRIRVRFEKRGGLRAVSHLDLMRAFERALRRTGLPLRMSEGFHPKPRLSFPVPLGVGIDGADEVMEFELADWVSPDEIRRKLVEQLPEGLRCLALTPAHPTRAARATGATYRIRPTDALMQDERLSETSLTALMARDEIPARRIRKRKEKVVNIRPFIIALRREGHAVMLDVTAGPEGSTRPEEVLAALGIDAQTCHTGCRITRTRITLADERRD